MFYSLNSIFVTETNEAYRRRFQPEPSLLINRCGSTMRFKLPFSYGLALMPLAVIGCGRSTHPLPEEDATNLPSADMRTAQAPSRPIPSPLDNSSESIDPGSAEAAQAVLASYATLLEQGHVSEGRRFWTEGGNSGDFEAQLSQFERFRIEVGDPGPMEGAAGSIYVEIPLQVTGRAKNGEPLVLAGMATLRRANKVPGSTEMQRRWHIYRVELQPQP